MSKNKIATAVLGLFLLSMTTAVRAEDAASASYQIRLAAYEVQQQIATSDVIVQPTDPDLPRPIKLKLRRQWKKTARSHVRAHTNAAKPLGDMAATDTTSKNN